MSKLYSIFLKDKCVLAGLKEERFKSSWETLNNLVGVLTTPYSHDDLTYEVDQEF